MVDFSPGPTLRVGDKSLPTHLCVLVDDHSRLIPFAAYYPQANTEAFHHALKEAILRRGLPRKLYTDQGKPFINAHTRLVCAQLGVRLLHCQPYHSWSKGKSSGSFKPFSKALRPPCAWPATRPTAWRNSTPSSRPGSKPSIISASTPASRKAPKRVSSRPPKPSATWKPEHDIDPLFYLHLDRTVRKNGTVRLDGELYEVPLSLRALKIQLRLDPFRRPRIEVWYQNKFMGLARKAPLHLNSETGGVAGL